MVKDQGPRAGLGGQEPHCAKGAEVRSTSRVGEECQEAH